MIAGDAPAAYTLAGAFVLGATLGTVAVIRVMRVVMNDVQRRRRPRGDE